MKNITPTILALLGACADEIGPRNYTIDHGQIQASSQSDPPVDGSYVCQIKGYKTRGTEEKRTSRQTFFTDSDITRIQGHYPNEVDDGVLSVFYATNSWKLFSNDLGDLRGFGRSLDPRSSLIIEGHADYRGSEEWNDELGRNRAAGVADVLDGYLSGPVDFVSYGEKNATQNGDKTQLQRERVVRVVPNTGLVTRALEVSPADVYLLDQSGSMVGEKWEQIQAFAFPPSSSVNTFRDPQQNCDIPLLQRTASGGTPLYRSLDAVISSMGNSQTITVLTDGEDTEGGDPAQIISEARAKKIRINTIGLGVTQPQVLMDLAASTGGQVYLRD